MSEYKTVRTSRAESMDSQGRLMYRDFVEWAEDVKGHVHFRKEYQEPRKHVNVRAISKEWSNSKRSYTFDVQRELILADGRVRNDKCAIEADSPDSLNNILETMYGIRPLTTKQREHMIKNKPNISDDIIKHSLPVTPCTDNALANDLSFEPVKTKYTNWIRDSTRQSRTSRRSSSSSSTNNNPNNRRSSNSITDADRPTFSFTQARAKYTFDLMRLYKRYLRAKRNHLGGKFQFINPENQKPINRQTITRMLTEARAYLATHTLPDSAKP